MTRRLLLLALLVGLGLVTVDAQIYRLRFVGPAPSPPASETNPISVARMPSTSATLPDAVFAAAGVLGGVPSTWPNCNTGTGTTGCVGLAPGGTETVNTANVNAAISGAQVSGVPCASLATACVVRLRSGSFTLATGLDLSSSFVLLRGAGPSSTLLTITANSGTACGYSYSSAVVICAGGGYATTDTTWTANYTKGDASISIGTRTNLIAGRSMVHLAQLNDDGYPTAAGIYMSDTGPPISGTSGDCGSPGGAGISGSCVSQQSLVTACATSCVGAGAITIDPPLTGPSMRSGRTNTAHFGVSTLQWVGLENLSIDWSTAAADKAYGIQMNNCTNCWIKNIRLVNSGVAAYGIQVIRSAKVSILDNYIYRVNFSTQENYGMVIQGAGSVLIQNNIFQGQENNIITDNGFNNSVIAYNFWVGDGGVSYGKHLGGESMILLEGNIARTWWADNIDAVACCHIAFRNALVGDRYVSAHIGTVFSAISIAAKNRMWSVVGNVMGDAAAYGASYTCTDNTCVYDLGGDIGAAGAPFDAAVGSTMFRWGNWDEVTSTAPGNNGDQTGTRWCGNSSNTGWVTRCGSATEVPSGIAFLPNPIPATETLPNSLYLAAKPAWWPASIPYPGIGPEVSGGSLTQLGGHVYLNPAADKYFITMGGPTNGSGGALTFVGW